MPVIMAGLDHRTVWRCTGAVLGQGFLHACCCATCVLLQTMSYTVWCFRSCSSSRSSMSLSRCVPFHCRQARVAKRHARLGPFLEVQFLDKLFLTRRCTTPGAVYVRAVRSVARGDTIGGSSWTRSCSLRQLPWSRP